MNKYKDYRDDPNDSDYVSRERFKKLSDITSAVCLSTIAVLLTFSLFFKSD